MSYNDDKRELLKLKQGLIEESETLQEERKVNYEVKGAGAKVSNFFYHYKWHVIVIAFFAVVLGFLIYSTVSKEKMDIRVLLTSNDGETAINMYYKSKDIELALEQYCPDFDNNGNVHVETYYINMSSGQGSSELQLANQTKLYGEVSVAIANIYIANRSLIEEIVGEDGDIGAAFVDLSALYPDDPNIVDKYFYRVKGTAFADTAKYVETCPDDMYIVIRSDFEGLKPRGDDEKMHHQRAMEVFDNIIRDIKVNPPKTE